MTPLKGLKLFRSFFEFLELRLIEDLRQFLNFVLDSKKLYFPTSVGNLVTEKLVTFMYALDVIMT